MNFVAPHFPAASRLSNHGSAFSGSYRPSVLLLRFLERHAQRPSNVADVASGFDVC
jgi:hypothetical protein